ncbi:3'-5' exonuclease [Rhizosphaericola mali]|uniref:3'-5' exonuclease n=1 Tax=Rhizosphaericola mali TaxID=2545455 RepID=UPI001781380D|nr:3'-5' exonuclease [Rhizosphaericola mali]
MKNYYLFIDTETNGLPKKWGKPYSETENWPNVIQVSWVIYSFDGTYVKEENYYISNPAIQIPEESFAIHHLSQSFLLENGKNILTILPQLEADIAKYDPIVIGHFIEFDESVIAAEFARANLELNMLNQPAFCTMMSSSTLIPTLTTRRWKLTELYFYFYGKEQLHPHNAIYDAKATAECFFTLKERFGLTETSILEQKPLAKMFQNTDAKKKKGWFF